MSVRRRKSPPRKLRLAFVVVGALAVGPGAVPAQAGVRTTALQRKLRSMPILSRLWKTPAGPAVLDVAAGTMTLSIPNQPVWAAFGKNDAKGAAKLLSVELGRQLAKRGFVLATGGGKGLPKDTEDGAYAAGGSTLAFSPKGDLESHFNSHKGNIGRTTHLIATGTGEGTGAIAREAPMAQAANGGVASYANGGSGTFGEFAAMLHNESGVMVFLKGTGGVADAAPGWMGWVDAKPGFQALSGADPQALARQAAALIASASSRPLSGRGTRAVELVSPKKPRPILSEADTKGRAVAAFLTDDPRESPTDGERTKALMNLWAKQSEKLIGKKPTLVVPADGNLATLTGKEVQLKLLALTDGARAVIVSPEGVASKAAPPTTGPAVRVAQLGYGTAEMGKFAAAREVTADAEVLFFTSARYNNLPALAYALRDDRAPFIAVLANRSTHADKLEEMIGVIEPKAKDRVIVAESPQALVAEVAARMQARAAAPKSMVSGQDNKAGLD